MELSNHIAKQLRAVYNGGNWSGPDLKKHLKDVTWKQATQQVYGLNTIATLVYHVNYYVVGVADFLEGGSLEIKDEFSFDNPAITNAAEWNNFVEQTYKDGERLALLIEKLPLDKMWDEFYEEQYGDYYRNLTGVIEHFNYHLGQIIVIKKILQQKKMQLRTSAFIAK